VLQLHKTEPTNGESAQEYGEFMHAPRKRFTDYSKLWTWPVSCVVYLGSLDNKAVGDASLSILTCI
jgi:hypothetical protein